MMENNNKWSMEGFGNFNPNQNRRTDDGPPAKRLKVHSESDSEDEENYSATPSPNPIDTTNPYNGPGPLAHSTPIIPSSQQHLNPQQQQQMQQFQNFMNPMSVMDPIMQQQWAAHYQMLQQQHQGQGQAGAAAVTAAAGYPLQNNQFPPPMYNFLNLHNSHTSGSSNDEDIDDSGNASMLDKPANEVTFCDVPGRLSLLASNKKVKVSLAEIKRRISAPECLNSSLLSAILRKAKNKEGGKQLAGELSKYNISLPPGRRKAAQNTAFTALVEGESMVLAKDFAELSKSYFPVNSIVYEFLKGITSTEDRISKYWTVNQMVQVVGPLTNILSCDTSPVCDRALNLPSQLHPESQKEFTKYSLLTHGFGTPALHSSWNTLLNCAKVLQNALLDPKAFCTQLQRPIPIPLAGILETESAQQQQHQQQMQLQNQNPPAQQQQFPQYPIEQQLQQQQYAPQMAPAQSQQIPKENPNGYLQPM